MTLEDIFDPNPNSKNSLNAAYVDTPFGTMIAIGNDETLFLLDFLVSRNLKTKILKLKQQLGVTLKEGISSSIKQVKRELQLYCEGQLQYFSAPLFFIGTDFQKQVWQSLCTIPLGETTHYAQQALLIGRPNAYRAVANANGANKFAIIVPCHRVVASDGGLGGYGSGLSIKKALLDHESCFN